MRYLRLFAVFFKTSVQTDMEYRADFFTRVIASLLGLFTTLGTLYIGFRYTRSIHGWTYEQTMVLLAIYYIMDGMIETFIAPNMRQIMGQVRDGTLDFVLLKPISAQFLATFRTINIWRMASYLVGFGLLVYALQKLAIAIGLGQAVAFAVTLTAGLMVVYSIWLFLVTLTFWFTRIDNIEQIVWQAFELGRYPIEIYPSWLRVSLTYVIPIVFIITVPAQALTGKAGGVSLGVAILVGVLTTAFSSAFWRYGLKHYTGASA